jgi:hypothetical protein
VVHAIAPGPLIEWHHLAHALTDLPTRLLVRTYQHMPVDQWDPNLSAFAPETLERLADLGLLQTAKGATPKPGDLVIVAGMGEHCVVGSVPRRCSWWF